jgi:hypothetical protein
MRTGARRLRGSVPGGGGETVMGDVIDIIPHLPHVTERVHCTSCGVFFQDIRPEGTPLEICECTCGRVGTLEVVGYEEEQR